MGTRAVYTFIDKDYRHSVYKHWDGYPQWACKFIANAVPLAWPLPRFEADEFAAAFVAANKKEGGDVRLTAGPDAHGDLNYAYQVSCPNQQLHVRICRVSYSGPRFRLVEYDPLFDGAFEDALLFALTHH
jgi:hypothetical protein